MVKKNYFMLFFLFIFPFVGFSEEINVDGYIRDSKEIKALLEHRIKRCKERIGNKALDDDDHLRNYYFLQAYEDIYFWLMIPVEFIN